jgi:hypothetical protein
MKIFMKQTILLLSIIFYSSVTADTLEDLGWEKTYDDFEENTTYSKSINHYSMGDDLKVLSVAAILIESNNTLPNFSIGFMFYSKDGIEPNELKWKTSDGNKSLDIECIRQYESGNIFERCIFFPSQDVMDSLKRANFIRIDGKINVDLKEDSNTKIFHGISEIIGDYNQHNLNR